MGDLVRVLSLGCVVLSLVGCSTSPGAPEANRASPESLRPTTAPPTALDPTALPDNHPPGPAAGPTATSEPAAPTTVTPAHGTVEPAAGPETRRGWSPIAAANDGPPARHDQSAVLDPVRQQVVLFGGRDAKAFGDTWIFDLAMRTWREVPGAGPAPRFGHGAVYDAANRRMLVVMGQGNTFFNDVWAFDLDQETWTELDASAPGPERPRPRYGQSAALDLRGRVLISHGFSDRGRFDDTWAFDVAMGRWAELTPAEGPRPLKRCLHALVYEAASDRLLLYGGCSSGFGPCPQGDMWAFDLERTTWTQLAPGAAAPQARSDTSLVYSEASQALFLFGGKTEAGASAETWIYDLRSASWELWEGDETPAARSNQATAFDAATGRVLIFGGLSAEGSVGDVWQWMP